MPERAFVTETWTDDDWFQELDRDQRYLFIYLWTNNHVKQAGVYQVTLATMAFETKFSKEELCEFLPSLSPKVEWYPEQNYIWVRNFIKRQCKSPKFLVAAAKCLKTVKSNGLVKEVLDYNEREHGISIPYLYSNGEVSVESPYSTDTMLIPDTDTSPDSDPDARSGEIGVVKGKEGVSAEEQATLQRLAKLKGWRVDGQDIDWLREFQMEFPWFVLTELKACVDYHSGRAPPKHKGIWKNRFRNWMIKKQEFGGKHGHEQRQARTGEHRRDSVEEPKPPWRTGEESDEDDTS